MTSAEEAGAFAAGAEALSGESGSPFGAARWVWTSRGPEWVNQYAEISQPFELDNVPDNAVLYVAADSECVVLLNGEPVSQASYNDFPGCKTYDRIHLKESQLRRGANEIRLQAYYPGISTFQYSKGAPGVIFRLAWEGGEVCSGWATLVRSYAAYVQGPIPIITRQLGFTFEYDGAKADSGRRDASDWAPAAVDIARNAMRPLYRERPIPAPIALERMKARFVSQGVLYRPPDAGATVAELMQTDYLSFRETRQLFAAGGGYAGVRSGTGAESLILPLEPGAGLAFPDNTLTGPASGWYLVLDLGQEASGLFELDIEAAAGTIVDMAYGEHLDDLRVRASVGGRGFAARIRTGEGRLRFAHPFRRIAGRYIQLHILPPAGGFKLYYAGLRPVEYPVARQGRLQLSDLLHQRIAEVSVRTLHLCMHEHYEDTPWREQALYAMDSRSQALCGYYCFGDYDFPEASFRLLGEGMRDDGYLELCAPAEVPITIPWFSLMWIVELAEHLLYSGRTEFARSQLASVRLMLDMRLLEIANGLLPVPEHPEYWHYYDWAEGLDDEEGLGRSEAGAAGRHRRSDAPLNMIMVMALRSAAFLLGECGDADDAARYAANADRLAGVIHARFWNAREGAYATYLQEGRLRHYAALTQSLALVAGVCPEPQAAALRARLAAPDGGMVPITLSHSLFRYQALLQEPDRYGSFVFRQIADDWGGMLFAGATSFWETYEGGDAFERAGSLSHGWSATPIYFYYAYVLGVRPLAPGFREFEASPCAAGLYAASGSVPTPYGPIEVSWSNNADSGAYPQPHVSHPAGTTRRASS